MAETGTDRTKLGAMDAPDADADVRLHKASAELVADLDRLLRGFAPPKSAARAFVRARETLQPTLTEERRGVAR
ncbi:hypothetical protein CDD83_6427 [Cordyceps sp. RAO-2017]|nr:hypothetical protein CDD83_6427 [Cordyceps sp. RAO-2017]